MLYLVITVMLCIAQSWANLTYLLIIIPNLIISLIQEFNAKKTIEKLSLVQASKALVVRDGEKQEVDNREIVLDDVVIFKIDSKGGMFYSSDKKISNLVDELHDKIQPRDYPKCYQTMFQPFYILTN